MAQMGIGVVVLTETKFVDDRYPKMVAGYTIMSSKAVSIAQGGMTLAWRENGPSFEVESVRFYGPNTLTYQLKSGDEQIYAVGTYIPPNCTRGVEDICRAMEACPAGYKLLIMGDLNANIGLPCDKQEEVIVDLLEELCLVDSLRGFWLWTPRRTATRARWTWSQQRGTMQHYSQPDYILARAGETRKFKGVEFRFPFFINSNHRTAIAVVRAGGGGTAEDIPVQAPEIPTVPTARPKRTRTQQRSTHLQLSALTQS